MNEPLLSAVGSVASVLSLALAIRIFFEVRRMHLFYKRHLLIPEFIRELKRHSKNADGALKDKRTEGVKRSLHHCDPEIDPSRGG